MPIAIPLNSIVLGTLGGGGKTILHPPMSILYFATILDRMEFLMGLKRGDLDDMQVSKDPSICFEMSEDLLEGCAISWTIFPEQDELMEQVERVFRRNKITPVGERVDIRHVIHPKMFTYRLFFSDKVKFCTRDREPVVSGQTLVTSSIHPCLCPLLYTLDNRKLMDESQYSVLIRLREVIYLDPLPMTFVEQKDLPHRALPIAWIDPASKASEIFKNERAAGSSLPIGFEKLLDIARVDVRKWDYHPEEEEEYEEEEC